MKFLTIIPTSIMKNVSTMHRLFQGFLEAWKVMATGGKKGEMTIDTAHIFHHEFDCETFMNASSGDISYIADHRDLFQKPCIEMLALNGKAHCWSCFIEVNAANAGGGEIVGSDDYPVTCGNLHFKPFAKDNEEEGRLQCSFFLQLAYFY
jgi:hypothetical protein